MRFVVLGLCVLLGCVDPGSEGAVDGGPLGDGGATFDASSSCQVAPANPSWLSSSQDSDLRRLTGIETTPAGATLSERSTTAHRNATRDFLQSRLGDMGYSAQLDSYGTGANVFAELEASVATSNTIVFGAHFDTVPNSPGANDNATGVAMVLAAARYARELPCRSQNLIFVFFDEEELGLIGSDKFAQLLARPDFGATITAVHTIDQNGWDEDGDRAFELERADPGLFEGYVDAKQVSGATMPIFETATGSTDHVSFRSYGFDAVGVTEEYVNGDTTPHYHLSSDSYATVNRDYLASTSRILLTMIAQNLSGIASARQLADASTRLGPDRLVGRASLSERYAGALQTARMPPPSRARGCRAAGLAPSSN